jgi:bifunctional non-homologous end joining protein LigD
LNTKEVILGPDTIEISNPDKVLYPSGWFHEAHIVDYYWKIADFMLPHIRNHPINMQRFPNGINGGGFYEKEIPDYFPDWIDRCAVNVKEKNEEQFQVLCNKASTLVYLAEQACITPHTWLCQAGRLDYPDKMIFDLDPPGMDFELVKFAARAMRELLHTIELESYLMTTGPGDYMSGPTRQQFNFGENCNFA